MGKGKGKNANFIPGAGNKQGGGNGSSIKRENAHNQTTRAVLTNPSHIGGRGGK